ncbi:MAG: phosphocholine cytidylyltransferase family protein [Gammaproteobacteria bacterium]|nr:phosphocholine cytidylyltransferase family protein [Gammaproteobacteria bacterium]
MSMPIAVILLAGMGSRLGRPHPKCLTPLGTGESILARQLRILKQFKLPIIAVVGFKKELIMEAAADLLFAYNPNYDTTNTSKSLLCGLENTQDRDVLWLNGDVVFDEQIIESILNAPCSTVAVNNARVAEEEIKYTVDENGFIDEISKQVKQPLGEALGINLIKAEQVAAFKQKLQDVDDQDYFERAMELLTHDNPTFKPMNIGAARCIEVDFQEDLQAAQDMLAQKD